MYFRQKSIVSILCFLSFFLCSVTALLAQKPPVNEYAAIDKRALQIPDSLTRNTTDISNYIKANFNTDKEKARASFIWIASTLQYDVDNMFAIDFYEKEEDKINKALKTHRGICENYAALFSDICTKLNIKSYVVEGYTKQNGYADYIPHAWCAALIDSAWFLFDPTWGSGYVNNGKFYRKINSEYFKVSPSVLIKSHMPFDFLWQFLYYPVNNQEFYEGKTLINKAKPYFSFPDSINAYDKQSEYEKLTASAARIESNGKKNGLIYDRLQQIKREIEYQKNSKSVALYNSAVADYNEGINSFNEFIQFRNKQFEPKRSDFAIKAMLDYPDTMLMKAKTKLSQIVEPDSNIISSMITLTKSIDDAMAHVKDQEDWLKNYLSKGKLARKSSFYQYSWFGIPLSR